MPSPIPLGNPPENWEELSDEGLEKEFGLDFASDLGSIDKDDPPSDGKLGLDHLPGGANGQNPQKTPSSPHLESDSEKCPSQGALNLEDLQLSESSQKLQAPYNSPKDCSQGGGLCGSTLWSWGGTI